MTKDQEKMYRERKVDILLNEAYNLESENAFSVNIILQKEKEKSNRQEEFEKAKVVHEQTESELHKTITGKKKKLTEEDKKILSRARNQRDGVDFILNQIKGQLSKLYETVASKANSLRAIYKNIEALEKLDLSNVPQLPFIEINGTRYQAKNNAHVLDEVGNLVLYIHPNDKTNTTSKSA